MLDCLPQQLDSRSHPEWTWPHILQPLQRPEPPQPHCPRKSEDITVHIKFFSTCTNFFILKRSELRDCT